MFTYLGKILYGSHEIFISKVQLKNFAGISSLKTKMFYV